jgi:hypothetical protein
MRRLFWIGQAWPKRGVRTVTGTQIDRDLQRQTRL